MRKLFVFLVVMLIAAPVFATNVDSKVSSNVVTFNSVDMERNRGPHIITLSSATNHIRLVNLSPVIDCYADVICKDGGGKRGYATYDTMNVILPAIGRATPNTVELNFSTRNLAFSAASNSTVSSITESAGNNLKVNYIVTGDQGDF